MNATTRETTAFPDRQVPRYTCRRVDQPIVVDGDLLKDAWQGVDRTIIFREMVAGTKAHLDSRAAFLWDDTHLYSAIWVSDPDIRTMGTDRSMLTWPENAVILSLAFHGAVYEIGLSPAGRSESLAMVWKDAYTHGSHYDVPEFDLAHFQPFVLGEDHKSKHTRGTRWGFEGWDFPGVRTAVSVDGVLNDRTVIDRGWSAEIALPWAGMALLDDKKVLPPRVGTELRIEAGRTEIMQGPGRDATATWTWGLHDFAEFQIPECYPIVTLSD